MTLPNLEAVGAVMSSEEAAIFRGFLFQLVVQLLSRLLLGKRRGCLDRDRVGKHAILVSTCCVFRLQYNQGHTSRTCVMSVCFLDRYASAPFP